MIEKYLSNLDIDVYICYSTELNGKEKEMVNNFKSISISALQSSLNLRKPQLDSLIEGRSSIFRFYEIMDLPKIGIETYKKIFNYFYHYKPTIHFEQTRLF